MTVAVQVQSYPALPSETELPEQVVGILASQGLRLSWQQFSRQMMSLYHGQGMRPVTRKMLEEAQVPADLLDSLFFSPEGFLQKFDCVLMTQPEQLYQARHQQVEEITRRREGGAAVVEQVNAELLDLMKRSGVDPSMLKEGGGKLHPTSSIPDVREQVAVSTVPR